MVEATISFEIETSGAEIRTRAEDFGSDHISKLWIGVYDTTTGNRIASDEFTPTSNRISLPVIYYDAHPQVVIVGVANYDSEGKYYSDSKSVFNDWDGVPIKEQLQNAETWQQFLNISFKCPTIGDAPMPDVSSPDDRIMMGVVYKTGSGRPFLSCNKDGSVATSENSDCVMKLADDLYKTMNHTLSGCKLYLYRLYSKINVAINAGPNAEVSNVCYRRCNLPRGVFLAERPVYTGETKSWGEWSSTNTPNFADTKLDAKSGTDVNPQCYYSDGRTDWIPAKRDNTFSFYQYENKHWGWKENPSLHSDRERLADETDYPYCLGHLYNSFASYYVVKMTVLDKNSADRKSAELEYVVHQGNCNDQWGEEDTSSPGRDYCVFRNMIYNYEITVNSLNSIITKVTTNNGTHDDGLSASVWEAKFHPISREGFDTHPWGTFTLPRDHRNVVFRIYQGRGTTEPSYDYIITNYSKEYLMNLKGIYWPRIDENTIVQNAQSGDLLWYWFFDISNNSEVSIGGPLAFCRYLQNNNYPERTYRMHMEPYTFEAQSDPDAYKVGFYYFDPDEKLGNQKWDSDRCSTVTYNVCHIFEWMPDRESVKLKKFDNLQDYNVYKFIPNSVTIDLNTNNPNASLRYGSDYKYYLKLYNSWYQQIGEDREISNTLTYTINADDLPNGNYYYGVYAKSLNTSFYSDSDENRGSINRVNPSWIFDDIFKDYSDPTSLESGFDFGGLELVGRGNCKARIPDNNEINEWGIQMGGSGSTSNGHFKLTVKESCKIKVKYWVNNDQTRKVTINVAGTEFTDDVGNNKNSTPKIREYEIPINVSGDTEIKIYSTYGDVYFFEISLSDM